MKDAIPGRTLSVACGDSCSPFCRLSATSSPGRGKSFHSGRALGKEGKFRPHRSTAGRSLLLSCKLYASAKASPFRERWHGASRDGEGCFRDEPSQSPTATAPPRGGALGKEGKFRPYRSTSRRNQFVSPQTFRLCQSLSLSGEVARRSRDGEGCFRDEPSQSPAATAPPRGGALGKEGKFRPHSSTAGRSLPLSRNLYASAKASPFRERWHGEAVTERVASAKISTSVCKFYAQALIFPAGRATINSVSSCPKRGCGQGSADPAHCREGRRPATGVLRAARAP